MNISSTRIQASSTLPNQKFSAPLEQQAAPSGDSDTFRLSRREKSKYITAGAALGGAALGSFGMAAATSNLAGTGASVFGGVSGALAGAAVVGIAGGIIAGAFSDDEGFGGLAAAYGGALIGAVVGGVGGGFAGANLGIGAGNALGYVAGAVAGGVVGGFAAQGMMKN
jgi:hypothetical protein